MSGGALELEDLAGVVGAVGLLATLADEFVGADEATPPGEAAEPGSWKPRESGLVSSDWGAGEGEVGGGGASDGGGGGGGGSPGSALRECLSGMAKDFFEGANKVRWGVGGVLSV